MILHVFCCDSDKFDANFLQIKSIFKGARFVRTGDVFNLGVLRSRLEIHAPTKFFVCQSCGHATEDTDDYKEQCEFLKKII